MRDLTDKAATERVQKENLHFEVDGHLLVELGERLVAKPSIALAELVKNSYDADATSVTISFLNVGDKGGTIIVEDNGEGMTLIDLKTKWMLIGTDYKERNPLSSKYGRPQTGRKGIGRFACRMISEKLILTSVSKKDRGKERIVAVLSWNKLEPGKPVSDFKIEAGREAAPNSTPTGTRLELQKTRSPWSVEDIQIFKKEILGLVNPFPWQSEEMPHGGGKQDPGLRIVVEAPEYPPIEGPLSDDVLQSSWGKLEGILDKNGTPTYHLIITSTGEEYDFYPLNRFKELGEVSFTVYLFSLGELMAELPKLTLSDLRRLGREQGGVKVFLDGFRVFRYGEPGDDWLKLEFDRSRSLSTTPKQLLGESGSLKRPMLSLPGNNQVFGAVFLSRVSNPQVSLTVTRDRLLENPAFMNLRDFVRLGIDWLTIKYAAYRVRERKKEVESLPRTDAFVMLEEIDKTIDKRSAKIGANAATVLHSYVNIARNDLTRQREEAISQISMLRVLASTGTMMTVFDHEVSVIVRRLDEMASDLQEFLDLIPVSHQNRFRILMATMKAWTGDIRKLANIIGLMLGKQARVNKMELSIHKAIEDIFAPFKQYMVDNNIEPLKEIPASLRTPPMYEAELQSILVNLMTNSIKALGEVATKKICVRAEDVENNVRILFLDTGSGLPRELPRERWKELFEPFVSYSTPSLDFGVGTGLGLTIVRDIVESYGGKVEFVDPPNDWSTCVRIDLPKVRE
jgi:signal transduction histidine kinase